MNLNLKRKNFADTYTLGNLFVNGEYFCDTLEDKDRGLMDSMSLEEIKSKKVYGQTAIPKGTYEITLDIVSSKFKDRTWAKFCEGKLPRLINVKGYEGVLIHVGNKAEDTLGCILVGQNATSGFVNSSTDTFKKLYQLLQDSKNKGEKLTIKIE